MDALQLLIGLARRPQETADDFRERLTVDRANAHPHHDNSIAWLLWHAAREIDVQLSDMSGKEKVWVAQGFDARFALPVEPDEHGYGHSADAARAIRVVDPALLFEHLDAVIDALVAYVETLDVADLDQIVDERWDPPVTRGVRLVSISTDALQHVAQAAYIAGMGAAAFE